MVNIMNYRSILGVALVYASTGSAASTFSGAVTPFQIESPDTGSCRMKGIDKASDNFKYFASVSSAISNMNEGCGRCIKITKDGAPSIVAFVLDVCAGCKNQDVKLSTETLSKLSIDPNSHTTTVNYKFVSCPRQYVSGDVKACLMEGASDTYIPLQFYNTQKVVKSVQINGVDGTQQKDSFFFAVNPKTAAGKEWYKTIDVELTSTDGESKTGTFSFEGAKGCSTSSFQFSAASTADGTADDVDGTGAGGGAKTKLLLPLVLGCIAAIVILVGSVFLVRRHRRSPDKGNDNYDMENQYMSPVATKDQHEPDDKEDALGYDFDESMTPPSAPVPRAPPAAAPVPRAPPAPVPSVPQSQPQYQQAFPDNVYDARAPPPSSEKRKYSYTYKAPSYAFSKPESPDRDRSSFDIDDLRHTEEIKRQSQKHHYQSDVVTSPQSYVRSTTLRRQGSLDHTSRSSDILGYPRSHDSLTGK